MDTWRFGLSVALMGMVGTMLVLACLSGVITLLKKLFPHRPDDAPAHAQKR
jgi:hypothetical protein